MLEEKEDGQENKRTREEEEEEEEKHWHVLKPSPFVEKNKLIFFNLLDMFQKKTKLNKTKKFKEEEEDEWFTNTFPGCFSKDVKESLRIVKESCLFLGGGGGERTTTSHWKRCTELSNTLNYLQR